MTIILTSDELERVTGYKMPKQQCSLYKSTTYAAFV